MNELTKYNKEEYYKEVVAPKICALNETCKELNVPFFFACAVKNNDFETKYEYSALTPNDCDLKIKIDKIPKLVRVVNGCNTTLPQKVLNIDCNFDL